MKQWGFDEFRREVEKGKQREKSYSLEQDDELTRQARFLEAKNSYEVITEEEREATVLSYRGLISKPEAFTFFWETKSPFSQWHSCIFQARFVNVLSPRNELDNVFHQFTSSEQFMMYSKAMLFLDRQIAAEILKTSDARKVKQLGRSVRFFNDLVWEFNRIRIVYEGNKEKFTQNAALLDALRATKGTTLVEAAPDDHIWGIGLAEDDFRARRRETWEGKNLLGEVLTQLRVDLTGEY